VISLDDVTKTYTITKEHRVTGVRNVSLTVARGDFLIITGRSGSGKTTLLNLAAGLTPPTSGRVLWDDLDLWGISDRRRSLLRNGRVGFVFQFPSLLPALTVLENVTLPTVFSTNGTGPTTHERARELLRTVGLADKLNVFPRQLSAGQQQRVVIARALFNQPQILLADEPTGELDTATANEVFDVIRRMSTELGITGVLVTHDPLVSRQVNRTVTIRDGRISSEVVRERVDRERGPLVEREFAVLDAAGRVQLPRGHLDALDLQRRVRLELEGDHIAIRPESEGRP
jgi:putative ABC transport system ATP-binding protein